MTKKAVIIFSGYNQRALVAFLRTLTANNVDYAIIADSKEDAIFMSSYKDKILSTRKEKPLVLDDLVSSIETVKQNMRAEKYVIVPSTEALNRFLIQNRKQFEDIDCEIPIADMNTYELVSDKYKFSELCKKYDILVPGEYDSLDESHLPCVAKPKQYIAKDGQVHTPFILKSKKDIDDFLGKCQPDDFYFQQYVNGDCLYLLYYFYKNGDVVKLSQNNKIQQPGGKSMIAALASDFHFSEESAKYERLFKSIGYSGLVMVEVKKDGNNCYMIEANPRFWGPSQFFVDAGVNLFEDFLFENHLLSIKPMHPSVDMETRYFWSGGIEDSKNISGDIVYYDYSKKQLNDDLSVWAEYDIYNREDTDLIFSKESK
jgi:predicted ATP-grasp superfamily ATP-dependent carboligase